MGFCISVTIGRPGIPYNVHVYNHFKLRVTIMMMMMMTVMLMMMMMTNMLMMMIRSTHTFMYILISKEALIVYIKFKIRDIMHLGEYNIHKQKHKAMFK